MTDDEARKTIGACEGWVDWCDDKPDWVKYEGYAPTINLDGDFTAQQLLAILQFAPKEG